MGSEGVDWPSGGVVRAVVLKASQDLASVVVEVEEEALMASRMCSRARPPFL